MLTDEVEEICLLGILAGQPLAVALVRALCLHAPHSPLSDDLLVA